MNDHQAPQDKEAMYSPEINVIQLNFGYLEFGGKADQADYLVEMLRRGECAEVECEKSSDDRLTVWFYSDGSRLRLDTGDYLVRRTAPDARRWEVWTGEDFRAELPGVTE